MVSWDLKWGLLVTYISVPAYNVPATTKVFATPLIESANAPGLCQYSNPIFLGPMPPELMIMARMKKTINAKTLILQIISKSVMSSQVCHTYRESQNSISPYAKIPKFESVRNITQKIRIHPHWGTASVQYPITRDMALYSLARTWPISI